jgi:hypothetical protein
MNDRDYKGYNIAQYYKNGMRTLYWCVELSGVEVAHDLSTLMAAKDAADHHIYKLRNYK